VRYAAQYTREPHCKASSRGSTGRLAATYWLPPKVVGYLAPREGETPALPCNPASRLTLM
jgi:hypothetical protein